jgi:hypothetical protein
MVLRLLIYRRKMEKIREREKEKEKEKERSESHHECGMTGESRQKKMTHRTSNALALQRLQSFQQTGIAVHIICDFSLQMKSHNEKKFGNLATR